MFQSFGHFVTDQTGEESLPVMIKCNWPAGERIIGLGIGTLCGFWSPGAGSSGQGSVESIVVCVVFREAVHLGILRIWDKQYGTGSWLVVGDLMRHGHRRA